MDINDVQKCCDPNIPRHELPDMVCRIVVESAHGTPTVVVIAGPVDPDSIDNIVGILTRAIKTGYGRKHGAGLIAVDIGEDG